MYKAKFLKGDTVLLADGRVLWEGIVEDVDVEFDKEKNEVCLMYEISSGDKVVFVEEDEIFIYKEEKDV